MSLVFSCAKQLLASLPWQPRTVAGTGAAADLALRSLCCDSRRAGEGSLFVCIRGAQSDGHHYILSAYEAGCRCFLVERLPDVALPPDAYLFLSDNTHRDLAYLAAAFYGYPAREMTIVGITGTKGKTTVAMLCHTIARYLRCAPRRGQKADEQHHAGRIRAATISVRNAPSRRADRFS